MAKDLNKKNLPNREYPASASEPSGLFKRRPKFDPAAMNGVYAGPDQIRKDPPIAAVYAGPEQMPVTMNVYAGPSNVGPSAMMVYAGPAYFNNPGMQNNPGGFAQPFSPQNPTAPSEPEGPIVFCQSCGSKMPAKSKFCSECGMPLPQAPKPEQC